MKAISYHKYGKSDVMTYGVAPKPKHKADEVLIKIHAAGINQADAYILQGKPFLLRFGVGLFKPKYPILGSDFSGVIEAVGDEIKDFHVGDAVFGQLTLKQSGSYADYAVAKPDQLVIKPNNVSHEQAAATPMAALAAVQGIHLAKVKKDTKMLIYGASGGVGTFLIQYAKALGAHVTAVCSTRNVDVATASLADRIIDYTKETWDKDKTQYDVIIGANGYNTLRRIRNALHENGRYIVTGGPMTNLIAPLKVPFLRKKKGRKFLVLMSTVKKADLMVIRDLLKNKALRPHIDLTFPLEETKTAFNHFMNHKTIGKTVIKVV